MTQQTYSALERNAETIGASRLLRLLGILGVDMVLGKPVPSDPQAPGETAGDKPLW